MEFYILCLTNSYVLSSVGKQNWIMICLNFMYSRYCVGSLYAKIKFMLLLLVHQILSSSVKDDTSKQV